MAVSREVARRRPSLPILMLTARSDRETVLEGFEAGADDYVTKPFDLDELLARIAVRLRRASDDAIGEPAEVEEPLALRDVAIDGDARVLRGPGGEMGLNPIEHDLLCLLISEPGHLFPREEIMQKVWHQQFTRASRTLDVHVRHLRVKLEQVEAPITIHAVRGVGYRVVTL